MQIAHILNFVWISIHALRKESDLSKHDDIDYYRISIHALRKESDVSASTTISITTVFQSTLSVRRATSNS